MKTDSLCIYTLQNSVRVEKRSFGPAHCRKRGRVISTTSKGELFSAYNILKAYYEVSLEDSTPISATFTASPSFYLSVPDDSLLMDEQMIFLAPVAAAPGTTSSSSGEEWYTKIMTQRIDTSQTKTWTHVDQN